MKLLWFWLIYAGIIVLSAFGVIPYEYAYHPYFILGMGLYLLISFFVTVCSSVKASKKSIVTWLTVLLLVVLQALPALRHINETSDYGELRNVITAFLDTKGAYEMVISLPNCFTGDVELLYVITPIHAVLYETIKFTLLLFAVIFTLIAISKGVKKSSQEREWRNQMKQEGLDISTSEENQLAVEPVLSDAERRRLEEQQRREEAELRRKVEEMQKEEKARKKEEEDNRRKDEENRKKEEEMLLQMSKVNQEEQSLINAASQGDAHTQYELGGWYLKKENNVDAVNWLKQAGNQGHVFAQRQLGAIYLEGIKFIEKDFHEATSWFEKAAEQNDTESQFELGYLFYHGEAGFNADITKGFNWLEKASNGGHIKAQYHLGRLYLDESQTIIPCDYGKRRHIGWVKLSNKGMFAQCRHWQS